MHWLDLAITKLFRIVFRRSLNSGHATTVPRLLTSQHLGDIRLVMALAFLIPALYILRAAGVPHLPRFIEYFSPTSDPAAGGVLKVVGVGALSSVIAWAYSTANQRLGTIDLFGCEITAICRVAFIVDFAANTVAMLRRPSLPPFGHFTSQEDYTPAFNKNMTALSALDAFVVTRVTEFYTYRKTMMDFLRRLYDMPTPPPETPAEADPRRHAMLETSYMQFLMYESARLAVCELFEFEPDREESIINILCSELPLYAFLMEEFGARNDYRFARLRLRVPEYVRDVDKTLLNAEQADCHKYPAWWRAKTSARELRARYEAMRAAVDRIQGETDTTAPIAAITPPAATSGTPSPLPHPAG